MQYKVMWEVSKYAYVEANSEDEAMTKVWEDEEGIKIEEGEITEPMQAWELKDLIPQ